MVRTRSGLARSASSLMVSIETGCAASTIAAKALSMASRTAVHSSRVQSAHAHQ